MISIRTLYTFGILLLVLVSSDTNAESGFGGIDNLVISHRQRVEQFFDKVDLTKPELRDVAVAVRANDYATAATELVNYYDAKKPKNGYSLTLYSDPIESADRALNDIFTWAGKDVELERDENGNILWNSLAGTGDGQFPTWLGRHTYMMEILEAYKRTSKPEYIERLNKDLWDWFNNIEFPAEEIAKFEKGTWAHPSNLHWISLNSAIRVCSWLRLWQNWQGMPISDEVKFLMLMSLPEHCDYLRWHHRHDGNFKVSEMTAISETAIAFDEFTNSADWLRYGLKELEAEIDNQFYPDGAQKELAFHYNRIVVRKMSSVANLAIANKIPVSQSYIRRLENLYRYMAYVVKPDGYGPMNNDSDRDFIMSVVRDAAKQYNNDEFLYIASKGESGKWDKNSYSVVMPWSGQAIFRSGFGGKDDWSYFELGPWGIGHQHYDKLHLSVVVGGRDILVDAGRYTYIGYHDTSNPWRNYFTGSESHNVILIDGIGQSAREREWTKPLTPSDYVITDTYAFARGTYNSGFKGVKNKDADKFQGRAEHTRNVLFVPQLAWIVIDTIDTDRPRQIDTLWHFHPDCSVEIDGDRAFTNDKGEGNLVIMPAAEYDFELDIVKGRQEPDVQGWYSERSGVKVPNPTVIYNRDIDESATFVWVLAPQYGDVKDFAGECHYTLDRKRDVVILTYSNNEQRLKAIIPLKKGHPRVSD